MPWSSMKWTEEAAKAYYDHRAAKKLAQEQAAEEYKKHKVIQQRVKELVNMLMINNQTMAANKLDIDALFQILQTTDASRAWLPPTMPPDVEAAVAVVGYMNSSFWTNEGIVQQLEVMVQSQSNFISTQQEMIAILHLMMQQ